jgi:hypothetical protein
MRHSIGLLAGLTLRAILVERALVDTVITTADRTPDAKGGYPHRTVIMGPITNGYGNFKIQSRKNK